MNCKKKFGVNFFMNRIKLPLPSLDKYYSIHGKYRIYKLKSTRKKKVY